MFQELPLVPWVSHTHSLALKDRLCLRGPAAASREFPGPELFCSMTHQAIRHGPELELKSWWCLERVLHNWYSEELSSLPTSRNRKPPAEPKGFRAEPWKWEAIVVNKTQGHCLFHTATELQLSKEAAATPVGHPTGCHPTHTSAARAMGWRQLHFHDVETNWDAGRARTPMFCRFPGLKQLQLNTSFFPLSEKHLLLVTKGLGMAYCVIA